MWSKSFSWLGFAIALIGTLLAGMPLLLGKASVLYTFYPPEMAETGFYIGAAHCLSAHRKPSLMDTGNNMKRIFLTALLSLAASAAVSEPSTNVAWAADTLNLVRSGDATRGAAPNDALECSSCHGASGASGNNTWPSLSGQPVGYMFKVIKDYQDGKLANSHRGALMAYIVEEMLDQDIVDIGAFFAAQSLPAGQGSGTFEAADLLDTLGDPRRLIPPCSVCHGRNG